MLESMLNAFRAPDIRKRLLFVLGILVIYRLLAHVLIPGINPAMLTSQTPDNGFFGLLSLFSGGDIRRMSVVGLGLNPYINATIIMQILQSTIPSLQALSREGEYGRNKITSYSRWLSVPLAALQAYGILAYVQATEAQNNVTAYTTPFSFEKYESLTMILALTVGSVVLMWLGELITEKGIGNGISFIIFAGIVSRVPATVGSFLASPDWLELFLFGIVGLVIIFVIIFVQEGQRRIPIQYANRVRGHRIYQGGSTFLPLRVNMAGVIPIIFAISILLFPYQIAQYFTASQVGWVKDFSTGLVSWLNPQGVLYLSLYFLLTFGFAFFYTFIVFKPDETANNLRKSGGFIPGIRPGQPTEEYLRRVALRITVAGAIFVASVAVLPMAIAALPMFKNLSNAGIGVGLGGTSVLIVVSVVVETMKQLEAQLMMRSYEGFIR
ncbi:MAG: preprotein translocase subunit SecY [Candidatus Limnocylindrales bacterium]|jgi:preprotein translocase subunit SecY